MTFDQIVTAVKDHALLTSTEATARVGRSVNRHYKRITSLIGMDASRFVTRNASTSAGIRTVTFTEIEKIDRIIDATDSTAIVLLEETSIHELRSTQPGSGQPSRWALQNTDADSVTVLLDTVPQTAYSLQADGTTTFSDLSGTDEPVFPESFHDVLVWFVLAEELLKKEKDRLAATYEVKAKELLSALVFHMADSPTLLTRQGESSVGAGTGGSSGGGGNVGGTAYTQTALITFDRDTDAPFAVTDTSAYVPNLYAEGVGNVTTDRIIGRDTAGTGESEQLTLSAVLDFVGSAAQGDILYRGAATWARLGAGTAGQVLKTGGAAANPSWVGGMTLLRANNGSTTTTTAENVDTVAISGLTALDTIVIYYNINAVTQNAGATNVLYHVTDAASIIGVGDPAAGEGRLGTVTLRQGQAGSTTMHAHAVRTDFGTSGLNAGATVALTTAWTGSWTLALRQTGVTSGGTLRWSWSVYKVAGQ